MIGGAPGVDSAVSDSNRETVLGTGRFLELVRLPDGWEYVRRKRCRAIVVLLAVTDEDRLLLVEQLRPAVGAPVIELPAGLVGDEPGDENEPLLGAAQRELREETGYHADELHVELEGPPSAGLSSEVVTFVRASRLHRVSGGGGVGSERIEVHEVELGAAAEWLVRQTARGALVDPKVYAGLYLLRYAPGA